MDPTRTEKAFGRNLPMNSQEPERWRRLLRLLYSEFPAKLFIQSTCTKNQFCRAPQGLPHHTQQNFIIIRIRLLLRVEREAITSKIPRFGAKFWKCPTEYFGGSFHKWSENKSRSISQVKPPVGRRPSDDTRNALSDDTDPHLGCHLFVFFFLLWCGPGAEFTMSRHKRPPWTSHVGLPLKFQKFNWN